MLKHDSAKNEVIRDLNAKIETEEHLKNTAMEKHAAAEEVLEALLHDIKTRQDKIASLLELKIHLEKYGRPNV